MTGSTHTAKDGMTAAAALEAIDLESTHHVICTLIGVLQRKFKEETNYMRPLMPPQANILFVLDREAAERMVAFMTVLLGEAGGFERDEFRFTIKVGHGDETLHRLRLEFPDGVNTDIIRKMLIATARLESPLSA